MTPFPSELIDGVYPISLRTAPGACLEAAGVPPVTVMHASAVRVRELHWQALLCRCAEGQVAQVQRLVAVLESDEELELQRTVLPVDPTSALPVDPHRCAACGGNIPGDHGVLAADGRSYHPGCVR